MMSSQSPSPSPSASSSASSSPPASPTYSVNASATAASEIAKLPILERLVSHFVSSKRSLHSTSYVFRANEIVTNVRDLISENAVLAAKNAFVRTGVDEQISALRAVRGGLEKVKESGMEDFQTVLKDLDAADARLKETMELLHSTMVESSFRPNATTQQSLHDFVDASGVTDLTSALHACIDRTHQAQTELGNSNASFDKDLNSISSALDALPARSPINRTNGENSTAAGEEPSPLPSLFRSLEDHATEMATLLQSLVTHYDLCVSALKHTEGGLGAATQAAGDLPAAPNGVKVESLHRDADDLRPISEEERMEMIAVIDNDAAEVDDVVAEIRDRASDMEAQYQEAVDHVEGLRVEFRGLKDLIGMLGAVGNDVGGFVKAGAQFMEMWDQEKRIIGEKMEELEGVRNFYEGFLAAYDGLLVEIERRRNVKARMAKVAQDAMAKLEKLYQEDVEERESFRLDQGEYLPSDLWPGLVQPPIRFEITQVNKEGGDIPTISEDALNLAFQRANART